MTNTNLPQSPLKKFFPFWQRWLFVFSVIIIVFGIFMALFNRTALFIALFDNQINPVFWGGNSLSPNAEQFLSFIYGVLGSTMAGWGITLAFVIHHPFRNRESWAWNALVLAFSFWYLTDTAISLSFGVVFNAIFNTLIFIAAMLPLFFTRKEFKKE